MQTPQLVAVDTNILLRLGVEDDEAVEAWQIIQDRVAGVQFIIPATVIAEAMDKARHDPDAEVRRSANSVLAESKRRWKMHPFAPNAAQSAIIANAARQLQFGRLIACEETNDALILAEAATVGCSLLVSNDSHLREIDPKKLKELFDKLDLETPVIRTMRDIVRQFRR